ncbi:MAG: hypothetical protein JW727_00605 [Candidatus Aenigmarchaeota archaeon]|nr:hypothetical protein [Candidatus Aenigmarchaeota archaeon]
MRFDDLIGKVRAEVKLSPWPYGARKADDFPYKLPLVVRSDGDISAISSESRGAILKEGEKTYKLKGVDPHGNIPKAIWKAHSRRRKGLSMPSPVHDSIFSCPLASPECNYFPLQESDACDPHIECGLYRQSGSFGVLSRKKAENELEACGLITDYLNQFGFSSPYAPVCLGSYENLFFEGAPTACIALEIPSIGSDLRLKEALAMSSRKKPDPEEAFEVYLKLAEWNGFCAKLHSDLKLLPSEGSLACDNYVLSRISRSGLGLLKTDHSSTRIGTPPGAEIMEKMQIGNGLFLRGNSRGKPKKIAELDKAYQRGLNTIPEPISESELMRLF